jgi:hypothetical protein
MARMTRISKGGVQQGGPEDVDGCRWVFLPPPILVIRVIRGLLKLT